MKPLAVAIDTRLAAYRHGGIARYAVELGRALRELEDIHPVEFRSRWDRTAPPGGTRIWTPPHHSLERIAFGVEALIHRNQWSVFHATDFITPYLAGAPSVATVHDLNFLDVPEQLADDARRHYQQLHFSAKSTTAWLTPSEWTASRLEQTLGIERDHIVVAPHGVSTFLTGMRTLPKAERSNYLLAVGTVEPRKNYDLLLDAFERIGANTELVIVGGAGWQAEYTQHRLETTSGVSWLTGLDDRALRSLYREALVVLVPSHDEGFGMSALEAMACGTPVVTSGNGALPEVTGDSQLTIASGAPEDWAAAILQLLEDEDSWTRLSNGGYRRSQRFTWLESARRSAAAYRLAAELR